MPGASGSASDHSGALNGLGDTAFRYAERVGPAGEGRPLHAYLAERHAHTSADEWSARIASGLVLVDDRPTHPTARLRRGQTVVWNRPPWVEPAAPLSFAVLHRDDHLLAVAKPAGLPVLPGAGYLKHTLLALVQAHDPAAIPLHRLGRHTSGIVLFARTPLARADVSHQLAARRVIKHYRALASGHPATDHLDITTPIGPVPHPLLGTVHAATPTGKPAHTVVTVLERRTTSSLLDVQILTGRPHQIRIHLASAGHPLVGDPLYGSAVPGPERAAVPGDPGYLLHAAEVRLRHPATGAEVVVRCAAPPGLRVGG